MELICDPGEIFTLNAHNMVDDLETNLVRAKPTNSVYHCFINIITMTIDMVNVIDDTAVEEAADTASLGAAE
jgi:hypothetical protein